MTEDSTARWGGEREMDRENAAAEGADIRAEEERELAAADGQPRSGWHVRTHPDIALWQDGRRIVGTREPLPAVIMRALRGAQQQGQLDALMRAALPPADGERVDALAADVGALRHQRDQAQGSAEALRRHRDDALHLLGEVRDERDEALAEVADLRLDHDEAQEQELTDDRPPMDLRSAALNGAIFVALIAAAVAVGLWIAS